MRVEIEIPKEFEEHFKQDKFEDTLHRLSADAHLIAGNYEKETAIMLIKAFKDSKPAYDVEKVVAELENGLKNLEHNKKLFEDNQVERGVFMCNSEITAFKMSIDIVKRGGV